MTKTLKRFGLAAGMLILVALACGGEEETPEATEFYEPPEGPEWEDGGGASLEIINNSNADIWYLYIYPSSDTDWGDDWLGASIIPVGESYLIDNIPTGIWDLRVEDFNHNEIETWVGFESTFGNATWEVVGTASQGNP